MRRFNLKNMTDDELRNILGFTERIGSYLPKLFARLDVNVKKNREAFVNRLKVEDCCSDALELFDFLRSIKDPVVLAETIGIVANTAESSVVRKCAEVFLLDADYQTDEVVSILRETKSSYVIYKCLDKLKEIINPNVKRNLVVENDDMPIIGEFFNLLPLDANNEVGRKGIVEVIRTTNNSYLFSIALEKLDIITDKEIRESTLRSLLKCNPFEALRRIDGAREDIINLVDIDNQGNIDFLVSKARQTKEEFRFKAYTRRLKEIKSPRARIEAHIQCYHSRYLDLQGVDFNCEEIRDYILEQLRLSDMPERALNNMFFKKVMDIRDSETRAEMLFESLNVLFSEHLNDCPDIRYTVLEKILEDEDIKEADVVQKVFVDEETGLLDLGKVSFVKKFLSAPIKKLIVDRFKGETAMAQKLGQKKGQGYSQPCLK